MDKKISSHHQPLTMGKYMNDNMSKAQKKQIEDVLAKLPPEIAAQIRNVDVQKMMAAVCMATDKAMVDEFSKHMPKAHLALQLSLRSVIYTVMMVADMDIHTPDHNKNLERAREKMSLIRTGVLNLLSTVGWA